MSLFPEPDLDDDTTLEDHPSSEFIQLELYVRDLETRTALLEQPEGRRRTEFALDALRIGVLALRHANSRIDVELLQNFSGQMLENLEKALKEHSRDAQEKTSVVLKHYFDPSDGRLTERLQRLLSDDGELARVFEGQLHGEGSPLAKRLDGALGPLLKQLDPQQSEGLLASLQKTVDAELVKQREHLLREFSLDNDQGALKRLVNELTGKHGDLSKDLKGKIDEVIKEFDLNKEDSALNRLVGNVERAQRTITSEFSLDNEHSSLRRLKAELMTILEAHVKTNVEFQEEVKVTLAKLTQKRESEAKTTEHGNVFEEAVYAFLMDEAQQRGDIAALTGAETGAVSKCKVGDVLIQLGPDTEAGDARIVFEAKDDKSYRRLDRILEETALARKNRSADVGVFVFAKQSAPEGMRPLSRFRNDLVVVWDPEDPTSDAYLLAAFEVARACCIEFHRGKAAQELDTDGIDRAINEIEKRAQNLEKIKRPAETIRSSSETILERVRIDQQALERQVALLREKLTALHTMENR